jgi:hypothetical protein
MLSSAKKSARRQCSLLEVRCQGHVPEDGLQDGRRSQGRDEEIAAGTALRPPSAASAGAGPLATQASDCLTMPSGAARGPWNEPVTQKTPAPSWCAGRRRLMRTIVCFGETRPSATGSIRAVRSACCNANWTRMQTLLARLFRWLFSPARSGVSGFVSPVGRHERTEYEGTAP